MAEDIYGKTITLNGKFRSSGYATVKSLSDGLLTSERLFMLIGIFMHLLPYWTIYHLRVRSR